MDNESFRVETVRQLELVDPARVLGQRDQASVDKHKPRIAAALGDLRDGLRKLATALQDAHYAVVFEPEREEGHPNGKIVGYRELPHGPALEAAVSAYCTLELEPHDRVNTPVRCHGAVGVDDPRIIDLAKEVNRLKGRLKATFQPLTNARVTATIKGRSRRDIVTKIPLALFILRQLQESSLNRLGAYRSIPLIRTGKGRHHHPPTPLAIRFTEAWTGSLIKRTVGQLIDEAHQTGHPHTAAQLQASDIATNEYVYSPKTRYLRMRANLWFPGATEAARRPKNYMGEMPILFLVKRRQPPPKVTAPRPRGSEPPRDRQRTPLWDEPIFPGFTFYQRLHPHDREFAS